MNEDTDNDDDEIQSPNVDPEVRHTKIDSIQSDDNCSAFQVDVLKDYDQAMEQNKIMSDKLKYRLDSGDIESGRVDETNTPFDFSNQLITNNSLNGPSLGQQLKKSNAATKSILRISQGVRSNR